MASNTLDFSKLVNSPGITFGTNTANTTPQVLPQTKPASILKLGEPGPSILNVSPNVSSAKPALSTFLAPPTQPSAPAAQVKPIATPSGAQVSFNQQGAPVVSAPNYNIQTNNVPSDVFVGQTTMADVEKKRQQYQEAITALQQAQQYSPEYVNALKAQNATKAREAELISNLQTGNNLPGDTLGYAQTFTSREKALNDIAGLRAAQDVAVQEAVRSGNITAAKAALDAYQPQALGAGQSLVDPITGQLITTAPTADYQTYQNAVRSGFKGSYLDFDAATRATGTAAGNIGGKFVGVDVGSPTYISELITRSVGGKAPNQVETIRPIQKAVAVIGQLGDLQQALSNTNTDPIIGTLRTLNPYDFDARAVQAVLQATVPNLARGVYGEVGVLTDQDIRNYIQTLPNIKGTKAQNDFVLAMTLKTVQRSLESNLETLAAAGYDISGFAGQYDRVSKEVSNLEKRAGIQSTSQPTSGGYISVEQAVW